MKKRRQQVSDSDTSSEKKSNIFQNQFFQDMFQDIKEIDVEPEELSLEEDSPLAVSYTHLTLPTKRIV